QRYAPEVLDALEQSWAAGTASTRQTYGDKAKSQLWTRTHTSFVAGEITATQARGRFPLIGVPTAERDAVINAWTSERELFRQQMTPAQIKQAYWKNSRNPATGAVWTRDEAIAALLERGYSLDQANGFLDA